MAKTAQRKPSSPLRDAMRLFLRNPTAVVALILILLLTTAAVTGELLTGKPPTAAQLESMESAAALGDTLDLDVNPRAVLDPLQTNLKDKFLPPLSRSNMSPEELRERLKERTPEHLHETAEFKRKLENVKPPFYLLGTDHLGRNVLAQLWAGSSISLTIGFLAVGIAVLLGVSLGGIAGYFGRRYVRMPMLVMLLSALIGGIAIPAEAPAAGMVFFFIAGVAFVFQLIVAIAGRRWKPVIGFGIVAAIVAGVFLYNGYIESSTPEGRRMQKARGMEKQSRELLMMTRDLGREVRRIENHEPGAPGVDWQTRQQMLLDIAYRNLFLAERDYHFNEHLTQLEFAERQSRELLARAEHLEAHLSEHYLSPAENEGDFTPEERRMRARHKGWRDEALSARRSGVVRVERTNAVRGVQTNSERAVRAAFTLAQQALALPADFDFQDTAARVNKLLEVELALKGVDREVLLMKFAETMAAAGQPAQIAADAQGKDLEELARTLAPRVEEWKSKVAELSATVNNLTEAKEDEAIIEPSRLELARLEQRLADAGAASEHAKAVVALDESRIKARETVEQRLAIIAKTAAERTDAEQAALAALDRRDYTPTGGARDPYHAGLEPSATLLNRRADLRARYLKIYEAEAKNRFEATGGLLDNRLPNGAQRYGVYRVTRHFITITILLIALIIAALVVAAEAQGAAEDLRGPVRRVFFPTISVDDLVMRFTEIMLTIPTIYLILAVLALFKKDVYIVMAVIGLTSWMGMTRFVRAEILSLREQDFIQAARALGIHDFRVVWRHLVPNAISPVLVAATIGVATAVLAESTLSFLGIGAGPDQPTWGQILSTGRAYITDASWLTWIPGFAILITVLSFNLLGEGLREAFNPKLRGR
jgi:ABC-type dipeptide/oligopeptide/nickel transport system permease subunit